MFNFIDMLFNFSEYLPAKDCPPRCTSSNFLEKSPNFLFNNKN